MPDNEKGRVVPIRLNEWELEQVERFALMNGSSSIGRAVKRAVITYVLEALSSDEEESGQTMADILGESKMALWKISQMADLALGDHDFEVKSSR